MITLVVNTCNRAAELALFTKTGIFVQRSNQEQGSAEVLSGLLEAALEESQIQIGNFKALTRIVFFSGPGSYTGLRVGSAFCQGLKVGLNIPCYSFSTFLALSSVVDVSDGFLALFIAASETDSYYCEFKSSVGNKFWTPQGKYRVIDNANLQQFISERKNLLKLYKSEDLTLNLETSKLMFEGGKLRPVLNFLLENSELNEHLNTNNTQELLYMKPVAAKTLAERKVSKA